MEGQATQQDLLTTVAHYARRIVAKLQERFQRPAVVRPGGRASPPASFDGSTSHLASGRDLHEGSGRVEFSRGHTETSSAFLVVEDDENDFALLRRALQRNDTSATVIWAHSGSEAMDALPALGRNFSQICVVVDLQLPDTDGFCLIESMKAGNLCPAAKYVLVTGNPDPLLPARATASGADAFFLKPCRPAEFLALARELSDWVEDR